MNDFPPRPPSRTCSTSPPSSVAPPPLFSRRRRRRRWFRNLLATWRNSRSDSNRWRNRTIWQVGGGRSGPGGNWRVGGGRRGRHPLSKVPRSRICRGPGAWRGPSTLWSRTRRGRDASTRSDPLHFPRGTTRSTATTRSPTDGVLPRPTYFVPRISHLCSTRVSRDSRIFHVK